MDYFEDMWRKKIKKNVKDIVSVSDSTLISNIDASDPIPYTKELINTLKENTIEDKIKRIFCKSACHIPHEKLESAKLVYEDTNSIESARLVLESSFRKDIKEYKNLTDSQVQLILNRGWGLAGKLIDGKIIATKIPSKFHEYFLEEDTQKKKYYYCHCPRVRDAFLENDSIDSIYCNCGGGFYQDVWEYITGKEVNINLLKSLFDGDQVCQFEIEISTNSIHDSRS
mgnify:CR=1 FL=1